MSISKQSVENLFSVGELVPCGSLAEAALCITSISDGQVELQPALPTASCISLDYETISAAINAVGGSVDEQQSGSPLHCFASEYLRRAEEARREAEVEAMWLSAGVCQIQ